MYIRMRCRFIFTGRSYDPQPFQEMRLSPQAAASLALVLLLRLGGVETIGELPVSLVSVV